MKASSCQSCRCILRLRLRQKIAIFQHLRRPYSLTNSRNAKPASVQSWYQESVPPSPQQLVAASHFFRTHPPRKVWTATEWRKQNEDARGVLTPEVAFMGRSNVGKSSLLNALLLSPGLNRTGPRPGKTTTMHAYALAATDPRTGGAVKGMGGDMDTKLTVLDMPGYGHASRDDWGQEILKYLQRRKQLRRLFVMLDPLHGVKRMDITLFKLLESYAIPYQILASKCDRLGPARDLSRGAQVAIRSLWEDIQSHGIGAAGMCLGDVLATASLGDSSRNDKVSPKNMQGIEEVRWAVLQAVGLEDYAVKRAFAEKSPISPWSIPEDKYISQRLSRPDNANLNTERGVETYTKGQHPPASPAADEVHDLNESLLPAQNSTAPAASSTSHKGQPTTSIGLSVAEFLDMPDATFQPFQPASSPSGHLNTSTSTPHSSAPGHPSDSAFGRQKSDLDRPRSMTSQPEFELDSSRPQHGRRHHDAARSPPTSHRTSQHLAKWQIKAGRQIARKTGVVLPRR